MATGAAAPGPSLLLVDDEEGVAATLAAVLEADGYRVETAGTVDEALARIAETPFAAAVLDLNVGADDGLVVLSRLKETSPATVAVVLTGYASVGSALGAIRAGGDGYLVKPCDVDELKATLTRGRERVERAAAERAALLGEIAEARERLAVVVEHLPVGVILAEAPSGQLLLGNRAVERIWRQPFVAAIDPRSGSSEVDEYSGYRAFHPDGRPYLPEEWPLARAIARGEIVRGELIEIARGDGTRGATRNHAAPLRDPEGRIVAGVVVFEDVTEEMAARRVSRIAADRTARLERLAGALAWALRPAEAAEAVLRELRPALGAAAGLVALADPDGATLEIVAAVGFPAALIERWRRFPADAPLAAASAYRSGRLLALGSRADAEAALPGTAALMAATGHGAIVAAPLRVDERVLGAFVVAFEAPRRFDTTEGDFAMAVAAQCAQALDRARLHGQTEQAERYHRLLADGSRLLAEARLDQAAVLDALAHAVAGSVADTCTIHLVDDDGSALHPAAVHDPDPARAALRRELLAAHPLRVGEGVAGRVVQSGQPVVLVGDRAAFEGALKPEYRPHADRLFFHSVAVVPLRGQHGIVGALAAERLRAGRPFRQSDVDLLQEIADRAALALTNARLYREARQAIAAREEFLSIAAHELRTPVTSLRGNAQLLARAKARGRLDEPRLDRFVSAIDGVDDPAGRPGRRPARRLAHPGRAAGAAAARGRPGRAGRADRRGARGRPRAGAPARGQPAGRALRGSRPTRTGWRRWSRTCSTTRSSTAPGAGWSRVELEVGGGEAHLSVADEGIGLPAGIGDEIFEPFGRAANAVDRALPGMGLGLYICRSIVERHGGRLWAESPGEDQGTTLHLTLPGVVADPPQ